ncbi:C-type lectin domain family 6 member A-like isoform X2 [Siniperca chuatsi]|uniref:C-type lectin domain family 6 member A-like isoform X2 n=1 Tax=Siniperca chuatsi TaxID=119488 RepID=UPI001CE0D5FE|nr:C-type lectin domain family 6 member A-like isoform X2 [Siniperca chuatsi]
MPVGTDETMGVNNGLALLEEEQQETSTDKKTIPQLLGIIYKPRCRGGAAEVPATFSTLQQIKLKLSAWLDSIRVVQIILVFQSQSALQETKLEDLTNRLEKLNQSYHLLFSQYPALNQYCPVSNSTTGERVCSPCPAGWTPQGEKCFLFSQDRMDWISSQYRCMALGGAVATVRTEEEQVFLWKKAQSLSQGDSYWLGLRSGGGDGGWQWSDGSLVGKGPQFWEREPDKTDSRELCGRLTPGDNYRTSWFTYRCSNKIRRICERRQATLQ